MDRDCANAPAFWADDLAISESEVVRGKRVPASEIHAELRRPVQTGDRHSWGSHINPDRSLALAVDRPLGGAQARGLFALWQHPK